MNPDQLAYNRLCVKVALGEQTLTEAAREATLANDQPTLRAVIRLTSEAKKIRDARDN